MDTITDLPSVQLLRLGVGCSRQSETLHVQQLLPLEIEIEMVNASGDCWHVHHHAVTNITALMRSNLDSRVCVPEALVAAVH